MKIFCLEDNALVVMHLEMVIEDAGHEMAGSAASFAEARRMWDDRTFDLVLVDIDLTDGRTGIDAVEWLSARGWSAAFVTGQAELAAPYADLVIDILGKPIDEPRLQSVFEKAKARLGAAHG